MKPPKLNKIPWQPDLNPIQRTWINRDQLKCSKTRSNLEKPFRKLTLTHQNPVNPSKPDGTHFYQ